MPDNKTGIKLTLEGLEDYLKGAGEAKTANDNYKTSANNAATAADKLDTNITKLGSDSEGSAEQFSTNMDAAAVEAEAAFLNVVAAVMQVGAAIIETVGEVAQQGDAIAKASQSIGISAQAYQEWDVVLRKSGSSMKSATGAIQNLTKNAGAASKKQVEAFEALGLSMETVARMQPEELFSAVVRGLQGIDNVSERTALANTLLGGSYKSLGTLLNTSTEDMEGMIETARKAGIIMSDEDIANAVAFQDSMDTINDTVNGIKNTIAEELMPAFTTLQTAFADLLTKVDWATLGEALSLVLGPAVSFLTEFLKPLANLALGGVTATLSVFVDLVKGLRDVLAGDASLGDVLWDLGDWNTEEPEKVLQEYEGLARQVRLVGQGLDDAFTLIDREGILGDEWNTEAVERFTDALGTFRDQLVGTAEDAPNAASATEDLDQQLADLGSRYTEALLNGSGDPEEQLALYNQLMAELTALSQKYQEIANQSPTEKTEEDAQQTAQEITAAGEKVAEGAATMLETFDSATGQLSDDFKSGTDEMSQAAVDSITDVNDAMNTNMAIVSANAQIWGTDMMRSFANGLAEGWSSYAGPQLQAVAQEIADMFGHSEPKTGPLSNDSTWMPDMMASFAAGIRQNRGLVLGELDALAGRMAASVNVGGMGAGAGASYNYGGVSVSFNVPDGMNGRELYEEFSFWLQNDMAREGAVWGH